MSIIFKKVSFHYQSKFQRVSILDNFNFEIENGEYIVIFGSSGSGKTSLLNLIAGFLQPRSGDLWIGDENISTFNEQKLCRFRNRRIGYIFQFFNLVMELSVYENIALPQIIAGLDRNNISKNALEIMGMLNIENRQKHFPYELSGGEQQRVAIARALVNNPDIILADEPTGNLDKSNGKSVMELLGQVHAQGKTVVVVTHDPTFKDYASRVVNIEEVVSLKA